MLQEQFGINPPYPQGELFKVANRISKHLSMLLGLCMHSAGANWLEKAVRSPRGTINPLHHIALVRLCGERMETAVAKMLRIPWRWGDRSRQPQVQLEMTFDNQ